MFINYPRKFLCICAALLACAQCQASSAATGDLSMSPQLPAAVSWAGTRELAAGSIDAALLAVKAGPRGTDSLLWLYKFGVINAMAGNAAEAVNALNAVGKSCPILAPLAMEQAGDIAVEAQDFSRAITAYGSALGAAELPPR
jgi:hypothetical protein